MNTDEDPTTFIVLDLESRPNPAALSVVGSRHSSGKGPSSRSALHHVVAGAALIAIRRAGGRWSDLRLLAWDMEDGREQPALIEIGSLLEELSATTGRLITYNGTAHDLPLLRRRAAALWLFDVPGLSAWLSSCTSRHLDLMIDGSQASGESWVSLSDACAALSIALEPDAVHPTIEPLPRAVRKAQSDVVATFLLLLHRLSLESGQIDDVARGWVALADMLRADHGHQAHLATFRTGPRLEIARRHLHDIDLPVGKRRS